MVRTISRYYTMVDALLLFCLVIAVPVHVSGEKPGKLPLDSLTARAETFIGISVDSVLKYTSIAIDKAQRNNDLKSLFDSYFLIERGYYQDNQMDSALVYARKTLIYAYKCDNAEKETAILHTLGVLFYKTGELDSALVYYQKENELEKMLGRRNKQASALGNIGMVYYRQSNYQKAIDIYFECLSIFQELDDRHKIMLTYKNIGDVYRFLEDYPKALQYYNKALELNKKEGSERFAAFLNNNLAIVYRKQKKYDSAVVYYQKAGDTYKRINYQKGIASALTGLAITYNKRNDLNKSFKTYLEAIKIQKKVNDRIGLASNYGNLAILLLDKEKPYEALKYLKRSDSIAKAIGYREVRINNYETFRDAYIMLGNYKKALDFELQYVALKDSVYNIEKLKKIEIIQEKYQAEQKQHKIDVLNEQARIKDIKLSRKNIAIVSLAIIIILAFMIGWLINHNNKTKAKKNLIIIENKLLRSQMNPHFLFNSLNAIQTYILRKNPLEGASYLAKFAELMRSILYNSREEFIPVEKEIKMIRNYLELQQIRFRESFSYSISIDPDLNTKNILIPPMLAQPFVENAIEHGLKDIDYPGRIDISFELNTESILIIVKDNGVGVEKSMERNKGREKSHKSLATVISKERLDLFNKRMKKELFLLDIKQLEDDKEGITGTEVRLLIPYRAR